MESAHDADPYVTVPGQLVWHTHTCAKCGNAWTHKAPTPMRSSLNEKIHTCVKCGVRCPNFTFGYMDDPLIVLGLLTGAIIIWLTLSHWTTR